MAIWDAQHESIDRERLAELQRLASGACWPGSTSESRSTGGQLDETGFVPGDLTGLDDLAGCRSPPRTTSATTYPYGLFAVPLEGGVRIDSSSGTTARPVVAATRRPTSRPGRSSWAGRLAAGATDDDVAQIAFGYGMFTGGFGLHYGWSGSARRWCPSAGNTAAQIQFMQDFGTTVLVATPSYALYLGEMLDRRGVDRSRLKLRLRPRSAPRRAATRCASRSRPGCPFGDRQLRSDRGHGSGRGRRVRVR